MTHVAELVVITVLNLNKQAETLRCLESVFRLDYAPYEVVLIDNGSTDGSLETIKQAFPQVHSVRSETNLGVAGGRNLGVEYATRHFPYAYLFFLDNDTWVDPASLRAMVRAMEPDPRIGLVAPKGYRPTSPPLFASAGGHHINWYTGSIRTVGAGELDRGQYDDWRPPTCSGGMALIRRSVVEEIGGFDNVFNPYGWEDVDFSLRARQAGFEIRLAPTAIVYHTGGKTGRGRALPEYERSKMRGYFILIRRHANRWQWACFLCLFPLRAIRRAIREIGRGHGDIVLAHVRGTLTARRTPRE
jgi:GT2 family glycosyltransferase